MRTSGSQLDMQAAVIREHGGPEHLSFETIERPEPAFGEALIRVGASALNHLDIFVREGMPGLPVPLPHIGGGDIAGWVEALGPETSGFKSGEPVLIDPVVEGHEMLGETRRGGLAEYVTVPVSNLLPIPDERRMLEFACLPVAYGTARRMVLTRAGLASGETMVVVGASGGVGVACVQLGKAAGAHVIACTSSEAKAAKLRELGADETVVAADGQFGKQVWALTGKVGADVVVDYSGKDTWPQSLRSVRKGGRLVCCGATSGHDAVTDLRYLWVREIDIRGSDGWSRDDLTDLVRSVETRRLQPVIHAVFPLSRVREALEELEARRAFGKVVVVPDAVFNKVASSFIQGGK
jgi:alcohol dehydrogenase